MSDSPGREPPEWLPAWDEVDGRVVRVTWTTDDGGRTWQGYVTIDGSERCLWTIDLDQVTEKP